MNHKNISKETIWAGSIIILSVLAGCFLLMKQLNKTADMEVFSVSEETILLPESDMAIPTSINASEDITTSESAKLFTEPQNVIPESTELPIETDSSLEKNVNNPSEITYDCPIDFETLWETNEDVYAWISVPGTVIDYPILQHKTDDSYYLNYTIDGTEGYPGCIYTEKVTSKDFTDNNTVIYGHNMRNGTMFTDLHKFRNADFFKENDTVYIYTPQKQLTYKIFAAYLYDDKHLLNSFDFSDETVFADYLAEIRNVDSPDANIRKDITISSSDKIITLITCIREQPEKRVYVQAVLLSPENT